MDPILLITDHRFFTVHGHQKQKQRVTFKQPAVFEGSTAASYTLCLS